MERYVAFDVETPNHLNNRISAYGVAVVEGGKVVEHFGSLVNPETEFDGFNVALTGITPAMAEAAPSFDEIWPRLRPLLESGTLLAHNAVFDLGVLGHCLHSYDLDYRSLMPYACTVQMGRRCFPRLRSHRLDTLCSCLGIPLDHHRADSDALACAELFLRYQRAGLDPAVFRRLYDLDRLRTVSGAVRP